MLAGVALKAIMIWVVILMLAMLNGAVREIVLIPVLGALTGRVLSGLLLSVFIVAATYVALPWLEARRLAQLLSVGLGWLTLTLVFEFSFGLWQGKSWPVLFEAYTFRGGNIWPVVLVVTALAPYLAARLRGWA